MSREYWIIGPGRVGLSLGACLVEREVAAEVLLIGRTETAPAHALIARSAARFATRAPGRPPARTVLLLTVPDGRIAGVARELADLGEAEPECVALHASGALAADVLRPLASVGYAVGSIHPMQTIADPGEGARRLEGTFFAFQGDRYARTVAEEIATAARGHLLDLEASEKPRYHAACVFASNYVVASVAVASRLLAAATGVGEDRSLQALRPLWEGAIANLEEVGLPEALTGPISRGDIDTIRAHLASLDGNVFEVYRRLGLEALALARRQGLAQMAAAELEAVLGG